MTKAIHQLLPTFSPNDAIGNEVIVIQNVLKKMGYDSKIFAENIHPKFRNIAEHYSKYDKVVQNDVIIYHHSIGSVLSDFLLSLKPKIIMIYHNVTPPEFYAGIDSTLAELCRKGKEQLILFKNKISFAYGDSEFNRLELENLGYKKTGVLPILMNFTKYQNQLDDKLLNDYKNSTNFLYVGRISPNKRIDEVIRIFSYYNLNINSNSNLFIVGNYDDATKEFFDSLQSLVKNTKLSNVNFISNADAKKLNTYYSLADIFITMSNHEGFCVPLIESMFFNVPIIARNSTAIPYTLGNSGILTKNESFEEIGELVDLILKSDLKEKITQKQSKQIKKIYRKDNQTMVAEILENIK